LARIKRSDKVPRRARAGDRMGKRTVGDADREKGAKEAGPAALYLVYGVLGGNAMFLELSPSWPFSASASRFS